MTIDIEELIKQRFIKAIKKCFKPCPLIGPRWFRYEGAGEPPSFQFVGAKGLAKATKSRPRDVVKQIVENLNMHELEAELEITSDCRIILRFSKLPEIY